MRLDLLDSGIRRSEESRNRRFSGREPEPAQDLRPEPTGEAIARKPGRATSNGSVGEPE